MTIGILSVDLPSAWCQALYGFQRLLPPASSGAVRGRGVLKKAGAGILFLNQMSELCHVGCGSTSWLGRIIWKQKILQTRGLSAATGQGMSTCLITKCIYAYQTSPYIHTWSLQARNKRISKCIRLRSMSLPCLYSIPHGIVVHCKPAAVDHSMGSKKQLDEAEICSETHGMYL